MSLVGFWEIDPDDEEAGYTEEQREAANFLAKRDWEGGTADLLSYGGHEYFPIPLRDLAMNAEDALNALNDAISEWAAERGVQV